MAEEPTVVWLIPNDVHLQEWGDDWTMILAIVEGICQDNSSKLNIK